jgi:hypothetical protein
VSKGLTNECSELVMDSCPGGEFFRGVVDVRNNVPIFIILSILSEQHSALAVDRVVEARVVRLQVSACIQDSIGDQVQVTDVAWEPWHLYAY